MDNKKNFNTTSGTTIIKVAAFAFAIISWKATAEGLKEYVFKSSWEASLISFAIQSILFVFNLKLPFYFNKLGMITQNRENRKYHFGSKKGTSKKTLKMTGFQKTIAVFYGIMLFSSSFFSFVYICNSVVYEHQSGYVDDNTILTSVYRETLNDTEDYINESKKALQLSASALLGELQEDYPKQSTFDNTYTLQELKELESIAQTEYDIAKEDYESAKSDVNALKEDVTYYAKQRNSTTWHKRQDEWEEKYTAVKEEWSIAKQERDRQKTIYNNAKKALNDASAAVNSYQESSSSIIADILVEMLKVTPVISVLEKDIGLLNDMIINLETEANVLDDYADIIQNTQSLTIIVNDYVTLTKLSSAENGIHYLSEHITDEIVIPDPKTSDFAKNNIIWKNAWSQKLTELESIIQQVPTISKTEIRELDDSVVNTDILSSYDSNKKLEILGDLRRSKVSDINVIEKSLSLLTEKYFVTAWFSLILAFFFDMSSLLAGLFLYGIQSKKGPKSI